jgi:hypothetical protein
MSAKAMMSLREAAASASSSSGSSRTWAQNVDIAELQKFQLVSLLHSSFLSKEAASAKRR